MKSRKLNIAGRSRWVALLTLVLVATAGAVEVPTLYTAEVPLDQEADDPTAAAHKAALVEVLMRVSGSELANNEEAIDELFPVPASYITQFRPGADETLWVSFDGEAIERLLRRSGQTVWGSDRPLTLVWLAIDWGQGDREIVAANDPERMEQELRSIDRSRMVRERVLEIAERRGLPIAFPLLDTMDLQNVTFTDIWGGFDEAVLAASERYEAEGVLIGRIRPGTSQRPRWTYYFGGTETPLSGTPESVLGQVGDLLAAEFAISGDLAVEAVALNVSGVASVDAYGSVYAILKGVPLIENFTVSEVSGDRISYQVNVRGGAERLGRALRLGGLIEQDTLNPDQPDALEFYFNP